MDTKIIIIIGIILIAVCSYASVFTFEEFYNPIPVVVGGPGPSGDGFISSEGNYFISSEGNYFTSN